MTQSSAKTATMIQKPTNTAPTSASRDRRSGAKAAASRRPREGAIAYRVTAALSAIANAWVEEGVEHVGQQLGSHRQHNQQHGGGLEPKYVFEERCLQDEAAQ